MADLDLSSFPLLRIDEVPVHNSSTLTSALSELKVLLQEDESGPMSGYVRKLIGIITRDLERRTAKERVESLLNGLNEDVQINSTAAMTPSVSAASAESIGSLDGIYQTEMRGTHSAGKMAPRLRKSSFRVPLPSELKLRSQTSEGRGRRTTDDDNSSNSVGDRDNSGGEESPSEIETKKSPQLTSRSTPGTSADTSKNVSGTSRSRPPRPRRLSAYSQESLDKKYKTSSVNVNAVFGSVHVVGSGNGGGLKARAREARRKFKARNA